MKTIWYSLKRACKEKIEAIKTKLISKVVTNYLNPHGNYEVISEQRGFIPSCGKKLPYYQFSIYHDWQDKSLKILEKHKQVNLDKKIKKFENGAIINAVLKHHQGETEIKIGKIYDLSATFITIDWDQNSWDYHDDFYHPEGIACYWDINKIKNTWGKYTRDMTQYLGEAWDDRHTLDKSKYDYVAAGNGCRLEFSIVHPNNWIIF